MATTLGNVAVGTLVNIDEGGQLAQFYVAAQNYESGLNGTGRTLVVRKTPKITSIFSNASNGYKIYNGSAIDNYLNNTYYYLFDQNLQSLIGETTFYCAASPHSLGTLTRHCFILSVTEMNPTGYEGSLTPGDDFFVEGTPLSIGNLIYSNVGNRNFQWTRTFSKISNPEYSVAIRNTGTAFLSGLSASMYITPAFTLPSTTLVDDFNNITPVPTISTLTVPSIAMQGQSIPISWSSISISGFNITYQLQRNTDNGGWTTIYTGSNTSYTDTAGTWTQVQYQVAAVASGAVGTYTQSSVVSVVSSQVLAISGSDGNLGTITSNVAYTVASNTGNPISLTRTVNGAQVVTLTVDSDFSYSIPISDLPTGTGTIQITASVENNSEVVTATRTWTYYKTPINIPSTGGIAQLTQNGQNIWPVTVPDAIEVPVYLGGNLNSALNKLGQAALYTKIGQPKYNEVTVDLSKVKVGDEVNLPYNGVMVTHIVVQIGNPDDSIYDSSCNGVWLLRKDCIAQGQWNSTDVNTLSGSTIMTTMQGYVANYDNTIQSAIQTVKIPYCVGGQSTTINTLSNGLECQMFPLSGQEVGFSLNDSQYFLVDGAKLAYFDSGTGNSANNKRIGYYNNKPIGWWLRLPRYDSTDIIFSVSPTGGYSVQYANGNQGYRPCFIMPTTFNQTYYVDSSNNIHPSQEYTQGGSITDVFGYDIPIAQTEVGTYVGTGQYGSSNPNSISLSFTPKFVCIVNENKPYIRAIMPYNGYGICFFQISEEASTITTYILKASWTQNGISWYQINNANYQLNESGSTYQYVAFG